MKRDPRDVVRDGYDSLAPRYLEFRTRKPGADLEVLDEALAGVPGDRQIVEGEGFGSGTHAFVRAHRL